MRPAATWVEKSVSEVVSDEMCMCEDDSTEHATASTSTIIWNLKALLDHLFGHIYKGFELASSLGQAQYWPYPVITSLQIYIMETDLYLTVRGKIILPRHREDEDHHEEIAKHTSPPPTTSTFFPFTCHARMSEPPG